MIVALANVLTVATNKEDQGEVVKVISVAATGDMCFKAKETAAGSAAGLAAGSAAAGSAAAELALAEPTGDVFTMSDDYDGQQREAKKPRKTPLRPDGKGGFNRPSGRAPTFAGGREKSWNSRKGEWE